MLANGTATAPVTVDGSGRGADLLAELGQRLRQVRKAKGLTLADVSDHLQIHYSAVSRLERGEYHSATPHLIARTERFLKLAAAEGYEPWFIDWSSGVPSPAGLWPASSSRRAQGSTASSSCGGRSQRPRSFTR